MKTKTQRQKSNDTRRQSALSWLPRFGAKKTVDVGGEADSSSNSVPSAGELKPATQAPRTSTPSRKKPRKRRGQVAIPIAPRTKLVLMVRRTKRKASRSQAKSRKASHQKSSWRQALTVFFIIIGLAGSVYFGLQATRSAALETTYVPYSPPLPVIENKTPLVIAQPPKTLSKSEPVRLRIPDIKIDTEVLTIGKQADNTMEVPTNSWVTGWYKHGPTPGEIGPAIIVGHVDNPKGPAVFWRLRELAAGQLIEVSRADGTKAVFKVDSIKEFEQNNFPTNEVYGNINHAGLRLITCGGTFDRRTGHYSHNTVVYATLVT